MANFISKGFPQTINGDSVIAFTDAKTAKGLLVEQDLASLESWYQEDPKKNHLGMVQLFANATQTPLPMYMDLIDYNKNAIIEVNGVNGKFTYELPISKSNETITVEDTSSQFDKPGIDGTIFELVLNEPFTNGDVLTYNVLDGCDLFVSNDYQVKKEGDQYRHYVKLVANQRSKYFPKDKLRAGVKYFKIGHGLGEFSTQYSKVTGASRAGNVMCEFTLGNLMGVEGETTRFAGSKYFDAATERTSMFVEKALRQISAMGEVNGNPAEYALIGSKLPNGQFKPRMVASTLEYFCLAELVKLQARQLMFQRGGVVMDNNGPIYLNEGAYHQFRRGFSITYSRPGGITRNHLMNAAAYIFRNRQDIPITKRRIVLEVGTKAFINLSEIFRDEFYNQLNNIRGLMGDDAIIKNPVTGQNDALKMGAVQIVGAFIPSVGNVEMKINPSFDYIDLIDRSDLVDGQFPITSYSCLIRDITKSESTNAFEAVPKGVSLDGVDMQSNNLFYIKPKGPSIFWGWQNGRWDHRSATGEVVGTSMNLMAQQFWCNASAACWVKDNSRFLLIELQPS